MLLLYVERPLLSTSTQIDKRETDKGTTRAGAASLLLQGAVGFDEKNFLNSVLAEKSALSFVRLAQHLARCLQVAMTSRTVTIDICFAT